MLSEYFASSPLRHAHFRRYYAASIGVAMGYTMTSTMAAWLMATMTPSALMVALVQTASTAPAFVVGLLAGSLADIVERRRVILATQVVFLAGALLLGVATLTERDGAVGAARADVHGRHRVHVLHAGAVRRASTTSSGGPRCRRRSRWARSR